MGGAFVLMAKNNIDKWLLKTTGKDSEYWLDFIGHAIVKRSHPIRGAKGLQNTKSDLWMGDLATALFKAARPKMLQLADENISLSRIMGLVLSLWSCRVIRAKAYDPRRNPKHRRMALERLVQYGRLLTDCLTDESLDAVYFPSQEWDSPYSPNARHEPDEAEKRRQDYGKRKGTR